MAFKIEGRLDFKEGFSKAQPVLLEPIMKVPMVVDAGRLLRDIGGDLNRRRGQIIGMGFLRPAKGHRRKSPGRNVQYSTAMRS